MADLSESSVEVIPVADADSIPDSAGDPKDICGRVSNTEETGNDFETAEDKVLKKPDKILPCPRCNSSNTKFCYYNNHNVNQPRHFCKNCQRYWTAGGTMRNVPVGAGRRKTKQSLQQQAHPQAVFASVKPLMVNEDVIEQRGPETPSCVSVTSVLDPGGQEKNVKMVVGSDEENVKELSGSSSVTNNNHAESDLSKFEAHNEQTSFPGCSSGLHPMHSLQGFPGPPWPYYMGQGCSNVAPWGAPLIFAAPGLCVPAVPFPIIPPFWACVPGWSNEASSVQWRGPNHVFGLSPSSSARTNNGSLSANDSPTLGKHSRDGRSYESEKEQTEEKTLWVPKTLRIDDPEEAAKSSIWSTLGIRPDESIKRGSLFRGFELSSENSGYTSNAARILHANPAALSRSQTFQESI